MLLLKLILTPLLIGGVTLVGRRFGPGVSGSLVGLPLTSGPVAFFLALEQGTTFAAHAALGTMVGISSLGAFCLAYCWLSLRAGTFWCWLCSWGVFLAATFSLAQVVFPLPLALITVMGVLFLALYLLPGDRKRDSKTIRRTISPVWDITLRMLIATIFVLTLTAAATILGPHLSGLLSPLPIFTSIVVIFTHQAEGAVAARQVLRGVIAGSFSFAIFFLAITILIVPWGTAAAFGCAILAAMLIQGSSLWLLHKQRKAKSEYHI